MPSHEMTGAQVESALEEINRLSESEYGLPLERLIEGPMSQERMQRLAGVLLKRPFARPNPPDASYNPTGANTSWHWDITRFDEKERQQTHEYELLKEIREAEGSESWEQLRDITHEMGLLYVLGRWINGKLQGEEKTFKDYYYEKKSPEVDLAINVANLLPVASVLAGVVGAPALAVQLALIVTKYGYEKLVSPDPAFGEP